MTPCVELIPALETPVETEFIPSLEIFVGGVGRLPIPARFVVAEDGCDDCPPENE